MAVSVVDAFWDTRSLGISCCEIKITQDDTLDDIVAALGEAEGYGYSVAKVVSGRPDVYKILESHEYSFVECSWEIELDLLNFHMPEVAIPLSEHVHYEQADDESKFRIYSEIEKGIFNTDRISLDEHFSVDIASRRYINWIEDELKRTAKLYHTFFMEKEVGFFAQFESVPGVEVYPFLAGLYNDYKNSGLGLNVVVGAPVDEALKRGCARSRTYASSNNSSILKLNELYGYRIADVWNVFVKHASQ